MSDFNLKEHLDLQRRHALVNEKLRVAVEALEKISKAHLGRMVYEEPNTWSEYTATEALAKIKGKLGEKEEIDPTPYCTVCGSMTKTDKICCQDNVDNN